MRTQEEKRNDTSAQSGTTPSSERSAQSTTQQSASSGDVARPLPSATEPFGARISRGALTPFRGGLAASPWDLVQSMSEEIDRLIDSLAGVRTTPLGMAPSRGTRGALDFGGIATATWTPQVEVIQKPTGLVLRADLPGLRAEDVNVNVEDGVLTISGERKQEHKDERDGFLRTERNYGSFYRAFTLPPGADEEKVDAKFKDGVLEVTIPVSGRERGRRIKINN